VAVGKRSYQQYCGLAVALDVVGERWALLVVRDLVPGPRRFKELFEGLPGIATDVLAERLRSLEAAGAVEQRALRTPVPAKVYALTDRGRQLAAIAGALAQWGLPLLPAPTSEAGAALRKNPRWALASMTQTYTGGLPAGRFRWTIDDEELIVDVRQRSARGAGPGSAAISYGTGDGQPLLDVRCTAKAFFTMIRRGEPGADVRIEVGDRELLVRFLEAMPLFTPDSSR